ncbi:MAG: 4-alpha-glucanotransferase, partial [Massilibacteroides sp.]|nr:4-alpha-glucanotransferase [Massilibacteroides sp.]
MRIQFNIHYNTVWGQNLCLVGSVPALGKWEEAIAPQMYFVARGYWRYELELPDDTEELTYRYFIQEESGVVIREWERGHILTFEKTVVFYQLYDFWLNRPADLPFYSSAFTKALFAHPNSATEKFKCDRFISISVFAPRVERGQYLALTGAQDALGKWNPESALRMFPEDRGCWRIMLDAMQLKFPFVCKFLIKDEGDASYFLWEEGENRYFDFSVDGEAVCISGLFFRYPAGQPLWKGAGTVIPVFSLRSEKSCGVGDLGDLFLLIDWAKRTGQCFIQVLPMNDTSLTRTWIDSYPYSVMSIYAIHPLYIDLHSIGTLINAERRHFYECKWRELNAGEEVDYEAVLRAKMSYCREFIEQEGLSYLMDNDEFRSFFERNKFWLMPYAVFCYLRDFYATSLFDQWDQSNVYDRVMVNRLCDSESSAYPEIAFTYYLQFVLDKQFGEVTQYARTNGIVLKGDLPIGVNRYSVEVWTEPDYFNLNGQCGAPPDDFSVQGQNWLFPTYRWETMEKDGYVWWKKRFAKMNDFFDCFRIDHILGFFRIWEIPEEYVEGLCGHFNPSLPLSADEIEQAGLRFEEDRFLSARIDRRYLPELFGNDVEKVIGSFLAQSSAHHYVLKP